MKQLSESLNLSILEIFSVLFPGGAFLLLCWQVPDIQSTLRSLIPEMKSEWQLSIAFLGMAYFLGYVLFYVSSFMDTPIYDRFKKENTALKDKVLSHKIKAFGEDNKSELNLFKWSCAVLLAQQPAMFAEVERLMAASKFFRSMTVVILFAAIFFAFQGKVGGSLVALGFVAIALLNYMRQRSKAVAAAYEYVVTLKNT
jgi:hypothetical protein